MPAAELKPLREPIDAAVMNAEKLLDADLVQTASFFWDLHRTNLFYPAYRMHGGKFAAELNQRLKSLRRGDFERLINTSAMTDAVFWLASRRTFTDGYDFKFPGPLKPLLTDVTKAAVAIETILIGRRYTRWKLRDYVAEIRLLRETASTEPDPYYRYWFGSLADQADVALIESKSSTAGFGSFDPFGWSTSDDGVDDDEGTIGKMTTTMMTTMMTSTNVIVPHAEGSVPMPRPTCVSITSADETEDDSSNTRFDRPRAPEIDPDVEPRKPSTPRIDLPADPELQENKTQRSHG